MSEEAIQEVRASEWVRAPVSAFEAAMRNQEPAVRLAATIALGRIHRPEAVALLSELVGDPSPGVRLAAVEALGWTPGGAPALRARIEAPTARPPWHDDERTAAIGALGRAGEATDVPRLIGLLSEPWPASAAAADALGRLGRRGISAAENATADLVRCTTRFDLRLVEPCAWALSRIGVRDPGIAQQAADRIGHLGNEQARAWLVKAAWPGLDAERRTTLFVGSVGGTSRLVQVAALEAVEADQVPTDIVAPWLVHPDGWIRSAAIGALGRLDTPEADEALARAARDSDRWTAAAAVEAAGASALADARDLALPTALRAAAAASLTEVSALVELAQGDIEPAVRSAAAGVLSEQESEAQKIGLALLTASDVAVREVAAGLLKGGDPEVGAGVLAAALVESDAEVFRTLLIRLDELVAREPKAWPAGRLGPVLARVAEFWSPRVAASGSALAARVKLPAPAPAPPPEHRPVLRTEIGGPWPALADVSRIRGARVRTDRGEFVLALDPLRAPVAVWNFALLAEAGWFNERLVHRLVPGFVMQTGCPRGDGWGGPGWTLPDEVSTVPFDRGSLGMARSDPDTGGSQWFVSLADTPHLTGEYTRFGEVAHGMSVVRRLRRGDRILEVSIERVP